MAKHYVTPSYIRLSTFVEDEPIKFITQKNGFDIDSRDYVVHLLTDESPPTEGKVIYYDPLIRSFRIPDFIIVDQKIDDDYWRFFVERADGSRELSRRSSVVPLANG